MECILHKRSAAHRINEAFGWIFAAAVLLGYPFIMLTVCLMARSHISRHGAALDAAWLDAMFSWGVGLSLMFLIVMVVAIGIAARLTHRSAAERQLVEDMEEASRI